MSQCTYQVRQWFAQICIHTKALLCDTCATVEIPLHAVSHVAVAELQKRALYMQQCHSSHTKIYHIYCKSGRTCTPSATFALAELQLRAP